MSEMAKKKKKIIRKAKPKLKPRPRPKAKRSKGRGSRAKVKKHSKAAVKKIAAKRAAKPAYSVLLDPSVCKSCQICIEVCPRGVFEKTDKVSKRGHHIIKVARPSECIGCLECEVLCPDLAITVEKA